MEEQDQIHLLTQEIEGYKRNIAELQEQIDVLRASANNNTEQQNLILENLTKLTDYIVPTEEDLVEQAKIDKQKAEELKKEEEELLLEEEQQKLLEEQSTEEENLFRQELLTQIKLLNDNTTNVEFQTKNTNAYLYIVCLGLLVVFVCVFIYKMIKKFMQY